MKNEDDERFGPKVVQKRNYETNTWSSVKVDEAGTVIAAGPDEHFGLSEALEIMKIIVGKAQVSPTYRIYDWMLIVDKK